MQQPIFPGKFDPFHLGHQAILEQALTLFEQITVAVYDNKQSKNMFTPSTRSHIITINTDPTRIKVINFSGLLTQLISCNQTTCLIRGIRNQQDAQYELDLIHNYQQLCQQEAKSGLSKIILPIIIPTSQQFQHISSSIIRSIILDTTCYLNLTHLLSSITIQYLTTNPYNN